MPRFRSVHTKILESFDFNDMPNDFTRLLWVLLPLVLDGEGRGFYNFSWIKSKIFPIREDISEKQIKNAMNWFANRKNHENNLGMIEIYSVDGHEYFYVPTFKIYQRGLEKEASSYIPDPQLQSNSGVTLEQLQSKSPLNTYTNTNANANANANAQSDSELAPNAPEAVTEELQLNSKNKTKIEKARASPTQLLIEKITGIPPSNVNDVMALDEIDALHPTEDDIRAGCEWLKGQNILIRHYSSLVNPIRVSIAKRVQGVNMTTLEKSKAAILQVMAEMEGA